MNILQDLENSAKAGLLYFQNAIVNSFANTDLANEITARKEAQIANQLFPWLVVGVILIFLLGRATKK